MINNQNPTRFAKTFARRADLKALEGNLKTLKDELQQIRFEFRDMKLEFQIIKVEFLDMKDEFGEIRGEFVDVKDILATLRSDIMGELKAIREEQTIGGYRQAEHTDQLEKHEERLTKLEAVAS